MKQISFILFGITAILALSTFIIAIFSFVYNNQVTIKFSTQYVGGKGDSEIYDPPIFIFCSAEITDFGGNVVISDFKLPACAIYDSGNSK